MVYYGHTFYEHKPLSYHPENPGRLDTALQGLRSYNLMDYLDIVEPLEASEDILLKAHSSYYIERIRELSRSGGGWIDPDTYVSEGTWRAALAYVGSAVDATKRGSGYYMVLGRPPGHHAGRDGVAFTAPTQGFCIFNASAIAAILLADKGHRVLVVDFDVHHGNGTQEILYRDKRIVHIDLHQDPSTIYPGTGWPWEIGEGEARGTKLNIILPPGCGDDCYENAINNVIEILDEKKYRPTAIVFDAGFDAYDGDGLASMRASSKTYYMLASKLIEEYKPSIVLAILEGGYGLGLLRGLPAFISALIGIDDPVGDEPRKTHQDRLRLLDHYISQLREELEASGG